MSNNTGARIKERRQELRMTLVELGNKVGVGASTVRKWETGFIKEMKSDKVQKLAEALETNTDYLFGWNKNQCLTINNIHGNRGIIGQTNGAVTTVQGGDTLSKEEAEIIRIYRELDVKNRLKLMSAVLELEEAEPAK